MTHDQSAINDYLKALPEGQRKALERLRLVIRGAVPDADECLSYGVPAFCLAGRPLVAYGAGKKHCSFYPMDPGMLEAHLDELLGFETSKGTIRFQPHTRLPDSVVVQISLERANSIRNAA